MENLFSPLMPFGQKILLLIFGSLVFINSTLIVFIVFSRRLKQSGYLFLVMLASSIEYAVAYYLSFSIDPAISLFWTRMIAIAPITIITTFVAFAYAFSNEKPLSVKKLLAIYIPSILFLPFVNTSYNVVSVSGGFNGSWEPGLLFYLFPIVGMVYVAWGIYVFIQKYLSTTDKTVKKQIQYIIGSFSIFASLLILTAFLKAAYPIRGIDTAYFGPIALFCFTSGIGYAMFRYNLFNNTKVVLVQSFTFLVWIFLLDRFLISENRLLDGVIFVVVSIYNFVLVNSTLRVSEQDVQLVNINQNLEKRVQKQTEKLRATYEIEKKARRDLEILDKTKNQFILATQHHLRTPLTILRGYIDILRSKDETVLLREVAPQLKKIDDATSHMMRLVNELLNISEYQLHWDVLKKTKESMFVLIKECVEETSLEIEKKKIDCKIRFTADAESTNLLMDVPRMRDALANLIDNAVQYTPEGGTILIRASVENDTALGVFVLEVIDSGIGISAEDMDKVFDNPFERGKEAERMNATGKGISLLLTKNIIARHGGKIRVASAGKGKGSVFTVELPIE